MAHAEKQEPLVNSSIDAILRGLTDRPNVQSTLILSRKDGSIIKVTGIDPSTRKSTGDAGTKYQISQEELRPTAARPEEEVQNAPKPVELLASSIFQFVTSASNLGTTLGTTSQNILRRGDVGVGGSYGTIADGPRQEKHTEEDPDSVGSEDEVQLLRMRTKHQEIVIFPDTNYICCVVQNVGKAGTGADRR